MKSLSARRGHHCGSASLLSAAKSVGASHVFPASPLELQRKAIAFNVFDAGRIETFDGTALDELRHEAVNTFNPAESAQPVCAVIHHDVQTIRQCFRDCIT